MLSRWRNLYGASPLHLLSLAASFALAAYAASKLIAGGHVINVVGWFVFAIIGHDLILFPLYSVLDRLAARPTGRLPAGTVNYLRAPILISGLLFLVYFPSILRLNSANYRADTSLGANVYLSRWLLISAALFVVFGLACALTARRRSGSSSDVTDAQHGADR